MPEYEDLQSFYRAYDEAGRLERGLFQLERDRTRELLERALPPPPAVVLDVGGGPGAHARWLAGRGYEVHLVDPVPRHVEQARAETLLASAALGDARELDREDASCDAVLMLGPLYHLTERTGRLRALAEAFRVLRPGGRLLAAGISRFASLLDGLLRGVSDERFSQIVEQDLRDGQHRNRTERIDYFTEAYFHRPDELRQEIVEAGFEAVELIAIEGPGALASDFQERWSDEGRRETLLGWVRRVEREPSLLGLSFHLMASGRRPSGRRAG